MSKSNVPLLNDVEDLSNLAPIGVALGNADHQTQVAIDELLVCFTTLPLSLAVRILSSDPSLNLPGQHDLLLFV